MADLMADSAGYHGLDPAHRARAQLEQLNRLPGHDLPEMIARLEEMTVDELASALAAWARAADPGVGRRLLLKLSAGMALAAADPVIASGIGSATTPLPTYPVGVQRTGIWHSRYVYPSSGRGQNLEGEHYIVLRQVGDRLSGQSLPHSQDSRLTVDLSVSSSVVTGSWTERTSPNGYYQGATYHGTLQLVVNPMGRGMSGRWLGFGKDFKVNTGEWALNWVDGSISPRAAREYHLKA
jgi:hypothetical protein